MLHCKNKIAPLLQQLLEDLVASNNISKIFNCKITFLLKKLTKTQRYCKNFKARIKRTKKKPKSINFINCHFLRTFTNKCYIFPYPYFVKLNLTSIFLISYGYILLFSNLSSRGMEIWNPLARNVSTIASQLPQERSSSRPLKRFTMVSINNNTELLVLGGITDFVISGEYEL